jgi:hypothetical protein
MLGTAVCALFMSLKMSSPMTSTSTTATTAMMAMVISLILPGVSRRV